MMIYQKYLIKLYIVSFCRMTLFLSSILIAVKTLNISSNLADESIVSVQDVLVVSFHIIPYIIYTILPFSAGIATVIVIHNLLATSQIAILKNAGVSSFTIFKPLAIVGGGIAIFMIFTSFFILPKTTQIRNEVQNSIMKSKIKNFIIPDSIKMLENVTIVTSPYNSLKHIPITFIHQDSQDGEFVFVGNIQETWSNFQMLGINANNATILTTSKTAEDLVKFQKLETQINFFANEETEAYLKHLNIFSLFKEYQSTKSAKCIKELNRRIIPSLSVLIIIFTIATLTIKFYRNRAGYRLSHIAFISIILIYTIFIPNNINDAFHTHATFWVVYINTALTFAFVYLVDKKQFLYKKHV